MSTATQVHIQPSAAVEETHPQMMQSQHAPFTVQTNQLQFNLHAAPQAYNLQTTFTKPRPIIIEKLLPASQDSKPIVQVMHKDDRSLVSSLSSERLELAMQLAKRDVKKLKTMLSDPNMNFAEMLENGNQDQAIAPAKTALREPIVSIKGQNKGGQRGKSKKEQQGQKPKAGKVIASSQLREEFRGKNFQLKFFDSEGDTLGREESPNKGETKSKEMTEIKRLRRELQKYVKRLDSVLEQRDSEKNSGRAKSRAIEEETEYERKSIRAEEQAARSARVLYMLQRKVQEIQDEIEEKGGHFKHTKKSQYLTRLAAAHRSAVRALQMFVNQAPLYYDVKHGLPPMYNELGLLIQQLSLLSSQFDIGKDVPDFDLDMLPRTKKLISSWNHGLERRKSSEATRERQKQMKLPTQKKPSIQDMKSDFLEEHREWLKQKAQTMSATKKNLDASRGSNEPTPEREAAMQAALDAIQRAKASASYIAPSRQEIEEKPGGVRFEIPRQIAAHREKPKSVLFPHRIKKHRQQATKRRQVVRPNKPKRESGEPLRFAQQTVSSVLKQQPEVIYQPKKVIPRSPKRNEIPDDVFISHGTLRQRDEEILRLASPPLKKEIPPKAVVSPRTAMRKLDDDQPIRAEYQNEIMQREAERQAWLDREREREMQRLQDLRKKEVAERTGIRGEYFESHRIVKDAEEKIKKTLQPLLEKAELISLQDKLKEDQYKTSVRRKLGEIVADTAMSKGELLADLILEDILTETANELQRLENEEEAEARAAFELDKPQLETVEQRMMEMEKEEEQIRRHWKQLHFSELKVANENENEQKVEKCKNAGPARPIIFTAAAERLVPAVSNSRWSTVKEDQPFHKIHFDDDDAPFVPPEMLSRITSYRKKHDNYLKRTITEEHGNFDPWKLMERISDDIVDEVLEEIQQEMDDFCDEYIEKLYADEFIKNDSLTSELNSESISK